MFIMAYAEASSGAVTPRGNSNLTASQRAANLNAGLTGTGAVRTRTRGNSATTAAGSRG